MSWRPSDPGQQRIRAEITAAPTSPKVLQVGEVWEIAPAPEGPTADDWAQACAKMIAGFQESITILETQRRLDFDARQVWIQVYRETIRALEQLAIRANLSYRNRVGMPVGHPYPPLDHPLLPTVEADPSSVDEHQLARQHTMFELRRDLALAQEQNAQLQQKRTAQAEEIIRLQNELTTLRQHHDRQTWSLSSQLMNRSDGLRDAKAALLRVIDNIDASLPVDDSEDEEEGDDFYDDTDYPVYDET